MGLFGQVEQELVPNDDLGKTAPSPGYLHQLQAGPSSTTDSKTLSAIVVSVSCVFRIVGTLLEYKCHWGSRKRGTNPMKSSPSKPFRTSFAVKTLLEKLTPCVYPFAADHLSLVPP